MGFGPPWQLADATFKFSITGDGRGDNYTFRPLSPQSFVAWSPPGALTTQSLMSRNRLNVRLASSLVLASASTLSAEAPWQASYVVVVPPTNSTVAKTVKGISLDTGIPLIPYLPAFYAIPNPVPTNWQIVYTFGGPEDVDVYIF